MNTFDSAGDCSAGRCYSLQYIFLNKCLTFSSLLTYFLSFFSTVRNSKHILISAYIKSTKGHTSNLFLSSLPFLKSEKYQNWFKHIKLRNSAFSFLDTKLVLWNLETFSAQYHWIAFWKKLTYVNLINHRQKTKRSNIKFMSKKHINKIVGKPLIMTEKPTLVTEIT